MINIILLLILIIDITIFVSTSMFPACTGDATAANNCDKCSNAADKCSECKTGFYLDSTAGSCTGEYDNKKSVLLL